MTEGWFYFLAMPYVVRTMWFLMWAYVFWRRLYSEKKFLEYLTCCDMRIIRYRKWNEKFVRFRKKEDRQSFAQFS